MMKNSKIFFNKKESIYVSVSIFKNIDTICGKNCWRMIYVCYSIQYNPLVFFLRQSDSAFTKLAQNGTISLIRFSH